MVKKYIKASDLHNATGLKVTINLFFKPVFPWFNVRVVLSKYSVTKWHLH